MKAYFKKLMGCILVLALMLSMIPVSALGADNSGVMPEEYTQESYAAEESGVESASYYFSGDFEYTVLDDGTASITDYLGSASEVIIPSTLDGYKVTTIGKRAFYECKALVNVEIPDSVTLIDDNAFFYCTKLVSVEIPDSVTEIGEYAFEGCRSLVSVKIPDSVTTIGAHSFSGCESLISIDIPDTVTDIGDYAFCGCTSLESIKIPHGITKIGDSVFSVCESLKSIEIPDNITEIGLYAFSSCSSVVNLEIPGNVKVIGDSAFDGCSELVSVKIHDGVEKIGKEAFYLCENLSELEIPDSVTYIDQAAFGKCNSLTSAEIPAGAQIDPRAFIRCPNLANIYVDSRNEYYKSIDGVLFDITGEKLVACPGGRTEYSVPDGVKEIGDFAFCGSPNIKNIEISDSVMKLGNWAIAECPNIKNITIPDSVTKIGEWAFYRSTNLTKVELSRNLEEIGENAFRYCTSLESIEIPGSLTKIAVSAFSDCSALSAAKIAYGVTEIGESAFYNCKSLSYINIPDSVTEIGKKAFGNCFSLSSIEIPDSITVINDAVFYYCENLKSVKIPDSVTTIGNNAFYECGKLKSIDIPNSVTSIGGGAFSACSGLKSIKIPGSVTFTGTHVFENCIDLENVEILDGVTSIPMYMFYYCTDLKVVKIPGSVTEIGYRAFDRCLAFSSDIFYEGTESDWNEITIGEDNSNLTYADIHFIDGSVSSDNTPSTRQDEVTSKIRITVYQNNSTENDKSDSYILSRGASVVLGGDTFTTGKDGCVSVDYIEDSAVTVEKAGFISQTITPEQLKVSKKVFLQPADEDCPVVSSVWADDKNVLTDEYAIERLSDKKVSLSAEVVWPDAVGEIYLMQDGISKLFANGILNVRIAEVFDVSEPIYIVAKVSDEVYSKKELKFTDADSSGTPAWLEGLSFSMGDSLSVTLPENVKPTWIANQEVGIDVSSSIPLTVTAKDGKVYVAIGLDLSEEEDEDSSESGNLQTTKKFVDKFKGSGILESSGESSWDKLKNLESIYKDCIEYPKGQFGFDASFTILGFAEGYYDSNAQGIEDIVWVNSGVIVGPKVEFSGSYPIPPIALEASLSAELLAQLNLYIQENAKNFTPEGQLNGEIELKGGVSAGIPLIVKGEVGVKGTVDALCKLSSVNPMYFKLTATGQFYGEISVLFFELGEFESEPWYEEVWLEYPSTPKLMRSMAMEAATEIDLYDTSAYTKADTSYLDYGSDFNPYGENGSTFAMRMTPDTSALALNTLKTNIYRTSEPKYLSLNNGTSLAVWVDAASSDINDINLYYSYFNGSVWSEPKIVCDDGTFDNAPYLALVGDTAYVAWQNATREFSDADSIESIASDFDISVASFDAVNGFETQTIECDGLDMPPMICGNDDVYVVWSKNSADDLFMIEGTNSICAATYSDGELSDVDVVYDDIGLMMSMAVDYNGGLDVAYSIDEDGDTSTNDMKLYENGERVTSAESTETVPHYYDGKLYWISDGCIADEDSTNEESLSVDSDYQIVGNGLDTAVVYKSFDEAGMVLKASYFNSDTDEWCEPIELTNGDTSISSFSASMAYDGKLTILVNSREIMDGQYGNATLAILTLSPYCDLTMGDLFYEDEDYNAGEKMEFSFELTNNGSQTIEAVLIDISDENGNSLSKSVIMDKIVPGQTIPASAYLDVSEDAVGQSITITAEASGKYEANLDDNYREAELAFEDLCVSDISCALTEDGSAAVSADIVNYGYSDRYDIVVELIEDTHDGEVLDSVTIDSLSPLDLSSVSFEVEAEEGKLYYVAINDSGDKFTANDMDYTFLASPKKTEDEEFVPGDADGSGTADSTDAVMILRALAGYTVEGFNEEAADFDGNGIADSSDAVMILRKLAGYN